MENASKALIMAGGILISVIVISVLVMLFSQIGDMYSEEGEALTIEQIEKANREFATYNNTSGLYGSELLSLANLVADYNYRLLDEYMDKDSKFYNENKIVVKVKLYNYITSDITDENGKKIKTEYKQRRT